MTDAEKIQALRDDAEHLARGLKYALTALALHRYGVVNGPYLNAVQARHKALMKELDE